MAIACVQTRYRFRTDALAVDGTPTWGAAENTTYVPTPVQRGVPFRLRFEVQNTGTTTTGSVTWQIFVSRNSGAYSAVTTSSSFVQSTDASSDVDDTTLATRRLTSDAGTYVSGRYDETGQVASGLVTLTASTVTEFEFGLVFTSACVVGDTYDFQMRRNSATTTFTFTTTPRVTISQPAGVPSNVVNTAPVIGPPRLNGQYSIYKPSGALNIENSDSGVSNRTVLTITDAVSPAIRILFQPNDTGNPATNFDKMSIGKWTGTQSNTTATPIEVTFGGTSGLSVAAGSGAIWSDWIDVSSLSIAATDSIVVIIDEFSGTSGYLTSTSCPNAHLWVVTSATWNLTSPASQNDNLAVNCGIQEVDSGPARSPSLTISALVNTAPFIGLPDYSPKSLNISALVNTAPVVPTPTLTKLLTINSFVNTAPFIGLPDYSPKSLSISALVNTTPNVPAISIIYNFSTAALVNTAPFIGLPDYSPKSLSTATVVNTAPFIGLPDYSPKSLSTAAVVNTAPVVSTPTLSKVLNLTTAAVINSAPFIGLPDYSPKSLNISALLNTSPVVPTPTLVRVLNLTTSALVNTAPFIGLPDYSPKSLSISALLNTAPFIQAPTLGRVLNLTTTAVVNSAPFIGLPDYSPKSLSISTLINTAPVVSTPTLGIVFNLSTAAVVNSAPFIGLPDYSPKSLSISALLNTAPFIGPVNFSAGSVKNLNISALVNSAPFIGLPDYSPKSLSIAALVNAAPIVPTPTLQAFAILATSSLVNTAPIINAPSLGVVVNLTTAALVNTAPVVQSPQLTKLLAIAGLVNSAPVIQTPTLVGKQTITVPQGNVVLSTTAPGQSSTLSPAVRSLVLSATAPIVVRTDNINAIIPARDIVLSETAPTFVNSDLHPIVVPQGNVVLSTLPAQLVPGTYEYPAQADLTLTTHAPTIVIAKAHHWRFKSNLIGNVSASSRAFGNIGATINLRGNVNKDQHI